MKKCEGNKGYEGYKGKAHKCIWWKDRPPPYIPGPVAGWVSPRTDKQSIKYNLPSCLVLGLVIQMKKS